MQAAPFSPAIAAAALPGACSLGDSAAVSRSTALLPVVGAVPHDATRQAEQELDDAIADLKTLSALALDAGEEPRAIEFSRRMVRAILSRTSEHQDRLAREHLAMVERSLDQGVDFFQVEGRHAATQRKPT